MDEEDNIKLGVDLGTEEDIKEGADKDYKECPKCHVAVSSNTNVRHCRVCGTKPFEQKPDGVIKES